MTKSNILKVLKKKIRGMMIAVDIPVASTVNTYATLLLLHHTNMATLF